VLDRGLVIDAFVRVSLVGIEILKIDVRVVVASVDTYLRFAEACNRLDLEGGGKKDPGLPEIVGDLTGSGGNEKSQGALSGVAQTVSDAFQQGRGSSRGEDQDQSQDQDQDQAKPRARRSSTATRPASRRTADRSASKSSEKSEASPRTRRTASARRKDEQE
jgi:hypothetical protein